MSIVKSTKVAVFAASLSLTACQGALSQDELATGEAAAALTASDEGEQLTQEAVAVEAPAEVAQGADDAVALDEEAPPAFCDFEGRRQQVLATYDADHDGRLGAAERQTLRSELTQGERLLARFAVRHRARALPRLHWVFDADGDHQLSPDERTAMIDALQARCERLRDRALATADANHDGRLDESERAQLSAALHAKAATVRQALLARFDANGDGRLDDAERQQLRNDLLARWQARKAQLVARYDTNGDGQLSPQEAAPLKAAIAQRIAEGRDPQE